MSDSLKSGVAKLEIRLGRIEEVKFGLVGYQEMQFGLQVKLAGSGWGVVGTTVGGWTSSWSPSCKWSEEDRIKSHGYMCVQVTEILKKAKKQSVCDLKGTPVEVTFEGMVLKSWRVLEEVL